MDHIVECKGYFKKMKKYFYYIISFLIILLLVFGAGFFTAIKTIEPETVEITKEIEVIKEVDKIVYRDVEKLTFVECKEDLYKYYTEPMAIDFVVNKMNKKYTDINVNWKLNERSGSQNAKIPVYQQGNWKFYTGVGIGIAGTAGALYGGYRLLEMVR